MEINYTGIRYNYKMIVDQADKMYWFSVKAIDKESQRTSWITTVNLFLKALAIYYDDERFNERFEDSDWLITKKELKKFVKKSIRLFTNEEYLPYFEAYLDFDRREGEWENIEE
jgi:hypothetical protein